MIANAWEGASARILGGLGFAALATSSGACSATDLPVSEDLEKGFGDGPEAAARAVELAAATGIVGGSIEAARRLQAYERAGADVLFAPLLPDLAAIRTVCQSVTKPANFMVGVPGKSFSVAELAEAGVRRISLATSLYRAAMHGLIDSAREVRESGTFGFVDRTVSSSELAKYLKR